MLKNKIGWFKLNRKIINKSICDKSNIIFTNWGCRQKLGLNRKDKYEQNRRN